MNFQSIFPDFNESRGVSLVFFLNSKIFTRIFKFNFSNIKFLIKKIIKEIENQRIGGSIMKNLLFEIAKFPTSKFY